MDNKINMWWFGISTSQGSLFRRPYNKDYRMLGSVVYGSYQTGYGKAR